MLGSRKSRSTFSASTLLGSLAITLVCGGTGYSQNANSEAAGNRFQFTFRHAPWEEVLKALADDCGFELSLDVMPGGTFNYVDKKRTFSADEAIDFINGYLLVKGYTLYRQNNLLLILDLREEIDKKLLRDMLNEIPLADLDKRGKYEITKTRFPVENADATEVNDQIKELLSPAAGSLIVMPLAKEIIATDAAGNLRQIRDIIRKMEATAANAEKSLHTFRLENASAEEVLVVARPLLDIEADENAPEDGSVRISADPLGKTVFATGSPEKIALVEQIVQQVDGDAALDTSDPVAQPVMEIHPVEAAEPDAVLRVLQTMFVGEASLRLEIDRSTGGIMALAPPEIHRSITATIRQMEANPDTWAVIPLTGLDPEAVLQLLEKMFSTATNPPIIGGTGVPPQLVARGTQAQLRQIQLLVSQMNRSIEATEAGRRQTGTTRMLNMNPSEAASLLERVQAIWPRLRDNQLNVIPMPAPPADEGFRRRNSRQRDAEPPAVEEAKNTRVKFTSVQLQEQAANEKEGEDAKETGAVASAAGGPSDENGDSVVVALTPQGLFLKSNDTEALDELTQLFAALGFDPTGNSSGARRFFLQHTEAETAMTMITNVMSGTLTSAAADESTIIDSAISAGPSSALAEGAPHMVTDKRLNAIYVVGSRSQISAVERWISIIDIESGPDEVLTFPKPRFIPVHNADAKVVETVLKSVFSNRIFSETANANQRGRSDDRGDRSGRGGFFGRGGFGGRGGNDDERRPTATQTASGELPKMTLGVDEINNAIVVAAPDTLFREVQDVVMEIDSQAGGKEPDVIVSRTLRSGSIETLKAALTGALGENAEIGGGDASGTTPANRGTATSRGGTATGGGDAGGRGGFGNRGGADRGGGRFGGGDRGRGGSGGDRGSRGRGGGR